MVVLHVLRPDVQPAAHYLSEYGNEAFSWVFRIALILAGTGLALLATVLRKTLDTATAGPAGVQAAGGLLVIAALFSTDRQGGEVIAGTAAGQIHGLASIGAFALLIISMMALSVRRGSAYRALGQAGRLAHPLAVLATSMAAMSFLLVPEAAGARQRAFLVIVFGWLIALAWSVRSQRHTDRVAGGN